MKQFILKKTIRTSIAVYAILQVATVVISVILPAIVFICLNIDRFKTILICSIILTYFALYKVLRSLIFVKIVVNIDKNYLKIVYPTFFFDDKKTTIIQWTEISSYLVQEEVYFTKIRLYMNSGDVLKFNTEDDKTVEFTEFIKEFKLRIHQLNLDTSSHTVKERTNIYQTTFGILLAILIICIMLAWPVTLLLMGSSANYGLLITFYSGAVFYLFKIYENRKHS